MNKPFEPANRNLNKNGRIDRAAIMRAAWVAYRACTVSRKTGLERHRAFGWHLKNAYNFATASSRTYRAWLRVVAEAPMRHAAKQAVEETLRTMPPHTVPLWQMEALCAERGYSTWRTR